MIRGPLTTRHYPNLPAHQHGVQRTADEFNAAEREWERKHPPKPKRKRRGRKTVVTTCVASARTAKQPIGFGG
jgi:hypothetical protein